MAGTTVWMLVVVLLIGLALGAVVTRAVLAARSAELSAKVTGAIAERDAAVGRVAELHSDRESLTQQFKLLSAETLAQQGRQTNLQLMEPVEKGLAQLNSRIAEVEKERAQLTASLREQVNTVVTTSENLRRETNALSTALRKPQVRGAWGELQLKRVVEIAGMLDHCDFIEQASDRTSADSLIRPDMKVLLGEHKFVYVDSKVPLSAYLDALETDDQAQREARLSQFGANVKVHIDALSSKQYWKASTGSPEFVVLFIPAEALAAEALAQRPDLHEYAAGKGIILASPTTLIAMLRTVAYSWKQAALADSAAEVFELGRELHDRLSTMGSHFNKLGRAIQSSVTAYNQTLGSLESRVLVSARRLRDLQVTDKQLARPGGVDESTKLLSAPELLSNAVSDEYDLVAPREPSTAELVADQQPTLRRADLRELG